MHRYSSPDSDSKQPEYNSWLAMLNRCRNPKNPKYGYYGGRGISVSPRWLTFRDFLADMGRRPGPGYEIDRIDNSGNYEPGNCRWVTHKTNMGNRRQNTPSNHLITWNGETHHAFEWCRRLGFHKHTLYNRITKHGWSVERAMTTPVRKTGRHSA